MKKYLLTLLIVFAALSGWACPVCEKNQPKMLQGISHGAGPQSNWDYVIVWASVIIVLATLFYTVKWLAKPGETNSLHIKRTVLDQA